MYMKASHNNNNKKKNIITLLLRICIMEPLRFPQVLLKLTIEVYKVV